MKIEISGITIKINGAEHVISVEDAKKLLKDLQDLVGEKLTIREKPYYVPWSVPYYPRYPYTVMAQTPDRSEITYANKNISRTGYLDTFTAVKPG